MSGVNSAVDIEHRAGDVGGAFGAEKHGGGSHFFRFAETASGNLREHLFTRQIAGHFRFNETGREDVDGDAAFRDLAGEGFGRADDAGFGGGVIRLAGDARLARGGSDAHDATMPLYRHVLGDGLGNIEKAVEIGRDDLRPLFGLHENQQCIVTDAGVVDQNIEALVGLENFGDGLFARRGIGDIEGAQFAGATVALDERERFLGVRLATTKVDEHMAAIRGQGDGDGPTDAPARSCHQRNLFLGGIHSN